MSEISLDTLREIVSADFATGTLRWKTRPPQMFPNARLQKSWNARYANREVGAYVRGPGYLAVTIFGQSHYVHRLLFALRNGFFPEAVDHINGNRADNREENLRAATAQINNRNVRLSKFNTSGEPGVYWRAKARTWQVRVSVAGRLQQIGTFKNKAEAVAAAREARAALGFHPNHGRSGAACGIRPDTGARTPPHE